MGLTESIIREGCSDQMNSEKERLKARANQREDNDCVCIGVEPPTKSSSMDNVAVSKTIVQTATMCPNKSPKVVMSSAQREAIIKQIQQWKKTNGKVDKQDVIPNGLKQLTTDGWNHLNMQDTNKDVTTGEKSKNCAQEGITVSAPTEGQHYDKYALTRLNYFTSMYEKRKMKQLNTQEGINPVSKTVQNVTNAKTVTSNNNPINKTNRKRPLDSNMDIGPPLKTMFIPALDKYDNALCLNVLPDGTLGMDTSSQSILDEDFLNVDPIQGMVNGDIMLDVLDKTVDIKLNGAEKSAVQHDCALDLSIGNSALNLSLKPSNPGIPDFVELPPEESSSTKENAVHKV